MVEVKGEYQHQSFLGLKRSHFGLHHASKILCRPTKFDPPVLSVPRRSDNAWNFNIINAAQSACRVNVWNLMTSRIHNHRPSSELEMARMAR